MQRAQELMGFGSESQFGVNIHDMPAPMFKHMDTQTLFKTMWINKQMNENVTLYLQTEEGNNERLKEALLKKDERMVEILIENGLLVPQKRFGRKMLFLVIEEIQRTAVRLGRIDRWHFRLVERLISGGVDVQVEKGAVGEYSSMSAHEHFVVVTLNKLKENLAKIDDDVIQAVTGVVSLLKERGATFGEYSIKLTEKTKGPMFEQVHRIISGNTGQN